MAGFVKIYGSKLITSSLWDEAPEARLVFLSLLAIADADGFVDVPNERSLARVLNLPLPYLEKALGILTAPDQGSRSPAQEGRRVLRDGSGWRCVNYAQYREFRTAAQEDTRLRVERFRDRSKDGKSYVYFARDRETGLIKIGYSTNPRARVLGGLKDTGCSGKADLIGQIEGSEADEKRLHRQYQAQHDHGEWFRDEGPLAAYLDDSWGTRGNGRGNDVTLEAEIRDQRSEADQSPRKWPAREWYRKFGIFWAEKKNRLVYGKGGDRDSKAVGELGEILADIAEAGGDTAVLAVQDGAKRMFSLYLGDTSPDVVKAEHPWSWFVTRFNGLMAKAARGASADFRPSEVPT